MIIDGKKIAEEEMNHMEAFVRGKKIVPRMIAIAIDPDVPTQQFLRIKTRVAERVGIEMSTEILPRDVTQAEAEEALMRVLDGADGIVLQLPLPPHIDADTLLRMIPEDLDPDRLGIGAGAHVRSHDFDVLPPVVSAIRLICDREGIGIKEKRVVVVGQGRLVGAPASAWLESQGASVTRLTRSSGNLKESVREAEILVLGAGAPGLITSDMITEGVLIFDAGTSEEGGKVVGDADPGCRDIAGLITPVPGGIGPIAVAELFGNLLRLRFGYESL